MEDGVAVAAQVVTVAVVEAAVAVDVGVAASDGKRAH